MEAPQRSTRDQAVLRARLEGWLGARLGAGAAPRIDDVTTPSATGMSSETLLFDAAWQEDGERRSGSFVARLRPDPTDVPVFPRYDMDAQFRVLKLVAEHTTVPVPRVRWLEPNANALGSPFFVMDRVAGRVPPDIMPYTMESWLTDATDAERRGLQDATVAVLTALHELDVMAVDLGFLEFDVPGATPLRRHVENQRRYYDWMRGERRFDVLERSFACLEAHWPADEGRTVLSWGDARIGNVLYDGFRPVAILDWEMAALGPRELDIGWMVFLHVFFQDITEKLGMPGLPEFLRRGDVAETYEGVSGYRPRDLDFYEMYAALRHGIVMARVHARRVHFGEAEWPDDLDSVIMHRDVLEAMLAGTFRSG